MNDFWISLRTAVAMTTAIAAVTLTFAGTALAGQGMDAPAAPAAPAPDPAAPAKAPRFVQWLALGDSITTHGPAEKLKWLAPTRGMASSSLDKDYVHLLQAMIQAKEPGSVTDLRISGRFARLGTGTIEDLTKDATGLATAGPDLVTIQTGENDNFDKIAKEEFAARYRALVDALLSGPKRPVIVCTGVWGPGGKLDPADPTRYAGGAGRDKDDMIQAICKEKGLIFVPVAPFASLPANSGWGEDPGVKWHPNDAGMQGYADAIFAALYPVSVK